jgi:DNA-binding transcriptional regulator YhcF (GntR family)
MTNYKNPIINYITKGIYNQDFVADQKLPSQHFFSIKFHVSKIVVINSLNKLRNAGIIYAIPKKGYYVSKHLSNIIKPFEFNYNITKTIKSKENMTQEDHKFLENNDTLLTTRIQKIYIDHYKGDEVIINATCFLSGLLKADYLSDEAFTNTILSESKKLTSIVNKIHFKDDKLILIKIYYGGEDLLAVTKNIIKKAEFKFTKEEFNLA